jgi:integrase
MTIRKRKGVDGYCVSAFTLDGTYNWFPFDGKKGLPFITDEKEAKEYEDKLKRELRAGVFVKHSPLRNFTKFYQEVFLENSRESKSELAQNFDEYYGEILLGEFGKKDLGDITPRMIENFLLKLSRTKTKYERYFKPVTIRMIYDRINQLYNLAAGEQVYLDNPCRLVKKSTLKKFPRWQPRQRWLNKYDPEEEVRLFKELDPRLQSIGHLILNTGMRPREILLAEKRHVNLTDKSVHYRFTERDGAHLVGQHVLIPRRAILVVHGKGGSTRIIPLNKTAFEILTILCNDKATGDYLVAHADGSPIKSVKKGFARACKRAGIEDLRLYDLRGTFATRLADRYVPMDPIISTLLGHKRASEGFAQISRITPGYTQATLDAMVRAVESLEYPPEEIVVFGHRGKIGAEASEQGVEEEKEVVAK